MVKYWVEIFLHLALIGHYDSWLGNKLQHCSRPYKVQKNKKKPDLGLRLDLQPFLPSPIVLPPTSPALSRLIPICFSANQSWATPCALTNPARTTQRPDDSIHYLPTADDRDDLFDRCFIWSVGISRYGELNEADVIESDAHWSVVKGEETGLPRPCVALRVACDRETPQHSPVETAGRPISLMHSDITLAAALSTSPPPLSAPLIRAEPSNALFPIPNSWKCKLHHALPLLLLMYVHSYTPPHICV